MALLFSVGLFVFSTIFCNFFVPIKGMNELFQGLSYLSIMKLLFENIILMIYGFDCCDGKGFSAVLYRLDIEDKTFWWNSIVLLIYLITIRSLTILALVLKANTLQFRKKAKNLQIFSNNYEFDETLSLRRTQINVNSNDNDTYGNTRL